MSTSKKVGMRVGRGLGALAAYTVKGVVLGAGALGEVGEGLLEGAESGYEDTCKKVDEKVAARKAKMLAMQAAKLAGAEAQQVIAPMVPVAPVAA